MRDELDLGAFFEQNARFRMLEIFYMRPTTKGRVIRYRRPWGGSVGVWLIKKGGRPRAFIHQFKIILYCL